VYQWQAHVETTPDDAKAGERTMSLHLAAVDALRKHLASRLVNDSKSAEARLLERAGQSFGGVRNDLQVLVTEQHAHLLNKGPALTFTALIPDMNSYNGRGGRVFPLYKDAAGP
jgi:hypothetical protein